jgi:ATP-dependent Clp protease ATP-binding subunit ClpA
MKKFIREQNIGLKLTDRAKEYFAETGFDPIYGARPLKRVLQKMILNDLAKKILDRTFREGDTVEVDVENGQVKFSREVPAELVS